MRSRRWRWASGACWCLALAAVLGVGSSARAADVATKLTATGVSPAARERFDEALRRALAGGRYAPAAADKATYELSADLAQTGADTVFHFAADPEAYRPWPDLVAPNVDALVHAYQASVRGGVRRFVFASSNHVMGGYQDEPGVRLTPQLPPRPGLRYSGPVHLISAATGRGTRELAEAVMNFLDARRPRKTPATGDAQQ